MKKEIIPMIVRVMALLILFNASIVFAENGHKCGFPENLEIFASNDKARKAEYEQQREARYQKTAETYLSPSGHFLVHYDTDGFDAVPAYDRNENLLPDYVEFVANAFDRAWAVEIDSLGFAIPPDDDGNPVTVYNVFCERMNFYGSTSFGFTPVPGDPEDVFRFSSDISISTDFSFVEYPLITEDPIVRDSLAIAVTAAHEFNHAIQLGYRLWTTNNQPGGSIRDLWLLESTATYMEEVVATQVNDYLQYIDCFLSSTDLNLTQNNSCDRIYGEVLLFIMLGEVYGNQITREIWEAVRVSPGVEALAATVNAKGGSLSREMARLAYWTFFSGTNSDSESPFPDAELFFEDEFPDDFISALNSVSFEGTDRQTVDSGELPPLSFQIFEIPLVASTEVLSSVSVTENSENWFGTQLLDAAPFENTFPANLFSPLTFNGPVDDIYLAVVSGNWNVENPLARGEYEIVLSGQSNVSAVYPNPVRPETGASRVTFIDLPVDAQIEIFNSNGLHLASISAADGASVAFWDLHTKNGEAVGSGVYIYRIVAEDGSRSGKIMVIR